MAHLIDNSKGFNAFVSYQKPAWHNLGEIFTEPLTTKNALIRGGLDFNVLKLPNVHNLIQADGSNIELISNESFFTYRTDVNKVLGSKLGKDYQVLQNVQALNFVDEILQAGKATIETAGAIDEGRKVFICLKNSQSITVGSVDKVEQFILIATSHDGSLSITATPTNVRVVCNNTLTAALSGAKGSIKIRHTANAEGRLYEAGKILKLINENTAINTDNYNAMQQIQISKAEMFAYFGNIFCTKDEIKALQEGNNPKVVLSTRKQNILGEVASFANSGIGQNLANNGGLNMWGAYNAVTGYLTGKKYKNANDRADSLLFGGGAEIIESAGVLALSPTKIQPLHKINFTGLNLN
jgi:phage/plasmid-like protein (TIGR03299 family)